MRARQHGKATDAAHAETSAGARPQSKAARRARARAHTPVKSAGKALDVDFHGNGTHGRAEVEQTAALRRALAHALDAQPVSEVVSIRQRRREAYHTHGGACAPGDVPHAAHDRLQHGAAIGTKQVHLVDDEQRHAPHVRAIRPRARHAVPLLWRSHNQVRA